MKFFPTAMILLLSSCGGTPFDEDYWDEVDDKEAEEDFQDAVFRVGLSPVSSQGSAQGEANLSLEGSSAGLKLDMRDVPQNIIQGQILITSTPCGSLAVEPPSALAADTRNYSYSDHTALASLKAEPSDLSPLAGKSLVVYAFTAGTLLSPGSGMFPFACGPLVLDQVGAGSFTGTETGSSEGGTTGSAFVGIADE